MFQNFEVKTDPANGPVRLNHLRSAMRDRGVTAFLIPHADEHQNEYLPARAERLAWLTGFTGSAGFCIVTLKQAVVFSDGRYTLQLREQVDNDAFSFEDLVKTPPVKWLQENLNETDIIAYDPWLTTINQVKQYEKAVKQLGAVLAPVENLVDQIWEDQPEEPSGAVQLHNLEFAGKPSVDKLAELQEEIQKQECDLCLLSDPASLAWAFNIRGSDMMHNPLALGFALLVAERKPILFMDAKKLSGETLDQLQTLAEIAPPETLINVLGEQARNKTVFCDPNLVSDILGKTIEDARGKIKEGRDPVVLPRAIKNDTEIDGARMAHLRDGVAMTKFLYWLDNQSPQTLDEITVATKLEEIRTVNASLMESELLEISFDTISGFGPNGAIVHYRVNEDSNRQFEKNSLYLCDSGAQYRDGTTDITRTIAIGTPPKEAVEDFTLVLKGHIKIALARFPKGTRGIDLDVLARSSLWEKGKDYAHGTGHGIGSYMNVHEGPQGIHRRSMEPLVPGMIVSNEPGYYVPDQYGIRIENLVLVEEAEDLGGNIETHGFETLTLTPIDLRLIDANLLTSAERDWLNAYHDEVFESLAPYLDSEEQEWLKHNTSSI